MHTTRSRYKALNPVNTGRRHRVSESVATIPYILMRRIRQAAALQHLYFIPMAIGFVLRSSTHVAEVIPGCHSKLRLETGRLQRKTGAGAG